MTRGGPITINKKAGETEADRKATEVVRTTDAKNGPNWDVVILVLAAGVLLSLLLIPLLDSTTNSGSSTSGRYLSDQTKRKLYYDMIAVQEQYPGYSPEWSQGVKEAAAKSYNVPMSQIDDIVREGCNEGLAAAVAIGGGAANPGASGEGRSCGSTWLAILSFSSLFEPRFRILVWQLFLKQEEEFAIGNLSVSYPFVCPLHPGHHVLLVVNCEHPKDSPVTGERLVQLIGSGSSARTV